jgi:hypothetical protein
MSEITEKQLVGSIARDLVSQFAPQELPLFEETSEAYFKNPDKVLNGQIGKEEKLGFDGTASMILLSPFALVIVDEVIKAIVGKIAESSAVGKLMKKLHLAREEEMHITLPISLTEEQLHQIHEKALSQALQFKLSQEQAELLADSLVGKLALINT